MHLVATERLPEDQLVERAAFAVAEHDQQPLRDLRPEVVVRGDARERGVVRCEVFRSLRRRLLDPDRVPQRRDEHLRVERRKQMREDPVGQRRDPDRHVTDALAQTLCELLGARESVRSIEAPLRQHRPRRVEQKIDLGVVTAYSRARPRDNRLCGGDSEQSRDRRDRHGHAEARPQRGRRQPQVPRHTPCAALEQPIRSERNQHENRDESRERRQEHH